MSGLPFDLSSYLGVIETLTLYGRLLDDGDFAPWLDLFEPQASLTVRGKTYQGRAGLEEFLAARPKGAIKHMLSMPLITAESATLCRARTDFIALRPAAEGGLAVVGSGRFNDRLQLSKGRWLFVEKVAAPSAGF